ncbi:benzoyl-CoA 2,3-epoxidase subunit BoxA [Ferrimicrobium sp.]|uniref:benzoyl-CoA 2,3-epoxidase subunit BoxA n=1 Tax=Ferrimicrobium sp. TaxID=2926050 RepID=UPI002638B2CF|nr:benzoyl-CoA 2,3-epoxidase subunit BoxA [Ferrimicrobium sp.]
MITSTSLLRQHLIDPEVCIRCNTCEETCPIGAITHNDDNYVVDPAICASCGDCLGPCPTGAIDSWRIVTTPHSIDDQLGWELLPEDTGEIFESAPAGDDEARALLEVAHQGAPRAVAPKSATVPRLNIATRHSPITATVMGNYRITDAQSESDVHHLVLDLGGHAFPILEGQSVGVLPPSSPDMMRPVLRLYSVSSPRDGERPGHNNLALTVKRVMNNGKGQPGLASNYLCDLVKGDQVALVGPFGDTFLMPTDPASNLIMICTGTGSAPFRAMTEFHRRHLPSGPGKLLLFFGARTRSELPYFGPLMKLDRTLIDIELCLSREDELPARHVQDGLRERIMDVVDLLGHDATHLYLCGVKGMEESVRSVLTESIPDWAAREVQLLQEGRLHIETY